MSRTDSLVVLVAALLAGASSTSVTQAAMFAASINVGMPGADSLVVTMIWGWVVVSAAAVVIGLAGGYLALRSSVARQHLLLAFFLLYSITLRVDNFSLGWPWQIHAGMVVGRVGFGVNIVGVLLLAWYIRVYSRPATETPAPLMISPSASDSITASPT